MGAVTEFQIDFLNASQFFSTFGDLIQIEQAKGFNLRHMTVLRSHKLKSYYVITKKLRQKSKIYDRKNDFLNFENMFLVTHLQGLQPPTNVFLIFNRFPKTLGSALLSLPRILGPRFLIFDSWQDCSLQSVGPFYAESR